MRESRPQPCSFTRPAAAAYVLRERTHARHAVIQHHRARASTSHTPDSPAQTARSFLYPKVISQGSEKLAGPSPATSPEGDNNTYTSVSGGKKLTLTILSAGRWSVRRVYCCKTLPLRTGSPGGDRRSCCCCRCCRRVGGAGGRVQQQGALLLHSPVSSDWDMDVCPLRNCAQAGRGVKNRAEFRLIHSCEA